MAAAHLRWFLGGPALLALGVLPALGAASAPVIRGAEVYAAACAACHGPDGRGAPPHQLGFDVPMPDFTDCAFASREPDGDWQGVAHLGGPSRAFSPFMAAFDDALSAEEVAAAVAHIRTFCAEDDWPRGDLNLPRGLNTEKAFPEDEAVLEAGAGLGDAPSVEATFIYEKRFGARNQVELVVPMGALSGGEDGWTAGLGDVAFGVKRAFVHSMRTGSIFSGTAEIVLPTGDVDAGLGKGTAVFEPFLAFGQIVAGDGFVQLQAGGELPLDRALAEPEVFGRTALGWTFTQGRFGRAWTPMVEVLGARGLEADAELELALVPQLQVALSRRQHVLLDVGVEVPVGEGSLQPTAVMMYLLWDWFDGGLFDGW